MDCPKTPVSFQNWIVSKSLPLDCFVMRKTCSIFHMGEEEAACKIFLASGELRKRFQVSVPQQPGFLLGPSTALRGEGEKRLSRVWFRK